MISIIIPVYNVESYIKNCLISVEAQNYTDYEVIIVDDCGTDRSMDIIDSFLSKSIINDKTRIIHHSCNRGLSAARNTGLEIAKGEYVYFLDSDDYISTDCLQLLYDQARLTNAEMIVGNIDIIGDSINIPILNVEKNMLYRGSEILDNYFNNAFYMMAWNKLLRRDFLLNNQLFFVEGLIHEDCAWSFSVACNLSSVALVKEKTYHYIIRNNSIQTDENFTKHYEAYCSLLNYYSSEAYKYTITESKFFIEWFERQKASFFSLTCAKGTNRQKKQIYQIIRKLIPQGRWTKDNCHYFFPSCIGFLLYNKFYGYKLL